MTTTIRPTKSDSFLNMSDEELKDKTYYYYTTLRIRISDGKNSITLNARGFDTNEPPLDIMFKYRIVDVEKSEIEKISEAEKEFLNSIATIKDSRMSEGKVDIQIKKDAKFETIRSCLNHLCSEDSSAKRKYGAIDITY